MLCSLSLTLRPYWCSPASARLPALARPPFAWSLCTAICNTISEIHVYTVWFMLSANIRMLYCCTFGVSVNCVWLCTVQVLVLCRCSASAHYVIIYEQAMNVWCFTHLPVLFCLPILMPYWCHLVASLANAFRHWSAVCLVCVGHFVVYVYPWLCCHFDDAWCACWSLLWGATHIRSLLPLLCLLLPRGATSVLITMSLIWALLKPEPCWSFGVLGATLVVPVSVVGYRIWCGCG